MDIRKHIKKTITEIFESENSENQNNSTRLKAELALIALGNNQIPKDLIGMYGHLSGADFDDSGLTGSSGEVEVNWTFNGTSYSFHCGVSTDFYYTKGSSGDYGTSIDSSKAPDPDGFEDVEVELSNNEIVVYNEDGEEFTFDINELGNNTVNGLKNLLSSNYDPAEETISSNL